MIQKTTFVRGGVSCGKNSSNYAVFGWKSGKSPRSTCRIVYALLVHNVFEFGLKQVYRLAAFLTLRPESRCRVDISLQAMCFSAWPQFKSLPGKHSPSGIDLRFGDHANTSTLLFIDISDRFRSLNTRIASISPYNFLMRTNKRNRTVRI